MTDLILYANPRSRAAIVRWMLEEVGQPYTVETVEYGPDMKSAAFRAMNPMGKIPVLRHGDQVVTECAAILAYLADAVPEAGLAPPPADRAAYYRWLFFAAGPIDQAMTLTALDVAVPEDKRGMVGCGTLDDVLQTIEHAIAGRRYVAGDRFSAADVMLGSVLGWGIMFGIFEKRPAFEAYLAPLHERPAFQRAMPA